MSPAEPAGMGTAIPACLQWKPEQPLPAEEQEPTHSRPRWYFCNFFFFNCCCLFPAGRKNCSLGTLSFLLGSAWQLLSWDKWGENMRSGFPTFPKWTCCTPGLLAAHCLEARLHPRCFLGVFWAQNQRRASSALGGTSLNPSLC